MPCCGQNKLKSSKPVTVRAVAGLKKPIRIMVEPGKVIVVHPGDTGIELTQSKALAYRSYVEIES